MLDDKRIASNAGQNGAVIFERVKDELRRGNTKGAARTQKRVKQLQQEVRR